MRADRSCTQKCRDIKHIHSQITIGKGEFSANDLYGSDFDWSVSQSFRGGASAALAHGSPDAKTNKASSSTLSCSSFIERCSTVLILEDST